MLRKTYRSRRRRTERSPGRRVEAHRAGEGHSSRTPCCRGWKDTVWRRVVGGGSPCGGGSSSGAQATVGYGWLAGRKSEEETETYDYFAKNIHTYTVPYPTFTFTFTPTFIYIYIYIIIS